MYSLSLHIFRRDLRLYDNTALQEALSLSASVMPCFIFDKRQIENNPYKSENCIQFMVNCLHELDQELHAKNSKLYTFYGITEEVVLQLLKDTKIDAVFVNRDYTPYSRKRDEKIAKICHATNVDFHSYADSLLHEPEEVSKPNQEPYTVFTPFFRKSSQLSVKPILTKSHDNFYHKKIGLENKSVIANLSKIKNSNLFLHGGRNEALALLHKVKNLNDYENMRNVLAVSGTTNLSAHNKFGTLSIREVYQSIIKTFNKQHQLVSELYWRDFFTHVAFHFPHVFSGPFNQKYKNIVWSENKSHFKAWCQGETGFPIVDAGMRQLNTTGFMHNRVRMIVASFLTKDLHINWRLGEKYFAQKLIDYDPAVNNGNWQWAASTGCDAQPYFRIFNPWLQQQKFDPECIYIKRWVPELAKAPVKLIHQLSTSTETIHSYPKPIVNHAIESEKAKRMYKQA